MHVYERVTRKNTVCMCVRRDRWETTESSDWCNHFHCSVGWHASDERQSSVCVLHSNSFRLKECMCRCVCKEENDDSQAVIIELPEWLKHNEWRTWAKRRIITSLNRSERELNLQTYVIIFIFLQLNVLNKGKLTRFSSSYSKKLISQLLMLIRYGNIFL